MSGYSIDRGRVQGALGQFLCRREKLNLGIQPEKFPTDQADKLAALHDGLRIVDNIHEKQKAPENESKPG